MLPRHQCGRTELMIWLHLFLKETAQVGKTLCNNIHKFKNSTPTSRALNISKHNKCIITPVLCNINRPSSYFHDDEAIWEPALQRFEAAVENNFV